MNKKISFLTLSFLLASFSSFSQEPLIMDGKETLYQRILTTPDCVLKSSKLAKDGKSIPAFSLYYVYERDDKTLKVGANSKGDIQGYLDKRCTIDWKMQTALMFTNSATRNRALIFKDEQTLTQLVESEDPNINKKILALNKQVESGVSVDEVISIEPENKVDWKKNFYLLPILDATETMFSDGNYTRLLNIASVTDKTKSTPSNLSLSNEIKLFKAAVVFVIDSSISMQPYIDRTRKAIQSIYKKIENENLENNVHFGLVSFRSDTKAVPLLEYTSKVYVKPGEVNNKEDFLAKVSDLKQAKVSSSLFDEDSYSGVNLALDSVDWSSYGGRYIVLITDAGAIEGSNKHSSTGLDAKELRAEAEHYGAAIYALHLLTKQGKKNHDKARAQYEDLTFNKTINRNLYYPVNAGDLAAFGQRVDELANALTNQVAEVSRGTQTAGAANHNSDEDRMLQDTKDLGLAMKLAYLGSTLQTKVPSFFEGWISDRDLISHNKATATPVTLLTKLQLSNLKEITSSILEAANTGLLEPEAMFSQLRSVAVSLGRDPNDLGTDKSKKISEMGILDEYLDGLPYKSLISELDEDTWSSMGADEQNQTILDLESKLNYYQKANDDTDRWIKLNPNADIQDAVYPIELDMLP